MPRPIRASREGAVVYTLIPTPTFVLEGGGFFCTYPHRPANFAIGGASSARWFGCGLAVWRTAGLVKKEGINERTPTELLWLVPRYMLTKGILCPLLVRPPPCKVLGSSLATFRFYLRFPFPLLARFSLKGSLFHEVRWGLGCNPTEWIFSCQLRGFPLPPFRATPSLAYGCDIVKS